MILYLIDASVAVEHYRPKATFSTPAKYTHSVSLRKHIATQQFAGRAVIFIPSFCIGEVGNTLGKWQFRLKDVFSSRAHYNSVFGVFIKHVHDRKFFYSYDLNRYHNLNTSAIIEIEHTTETEFDATGLPVGTDTKLIEEKLKENNPYDKISRHYLSTFDILIIAMGMELKRITGEEIHLLTCDKRLAVVSSRNPKDFPKPYYWPRLRVSDLPTK